MIYGCQFFDFHVAVASNLNSKPIGLIVKRLSGDGANDLAFLISALGG